MKHSHLIALLMFGVASFIGTLTLFSFNNTIQQVVFSNIGKLSDNLASVFFQESITVAQLKSKYNGTIFNQTKVHVLIMPGHEPNYGGTEFNGVLERELNVELGNDLADYLQSDSHFTSFVARDNNVWSLKLANYFSTEWNNIITFAAAQKTEMFRLVGLGAIKPLSSGIVHTGVSSDVATRLYGINKWSNENGIDIAIHIHFNDYPRSNTATAGKYSGFAIYVPEKQYSNSTTTRAVAGSIFKRLEKYNAVSNMPKESSGLVDEQDLIAVGADNSANAASMLIEYGYIYEPQFQNPETRSMALKDLAYQTYLGLEDFFKDGTVDSRVYDTVALPYVWKNPISKNTAKSQKQDIFALQTALGIDGVYPGVSKTKNDCPRSGFLGDCTLQAISAFQTKYAITDEQGYVGPKTTALLNAEFGK